MPQRITTTQRRSQGPRARISAGSNGWRMAVCAGSCVNLVINPCPACAKDETSNNKCPFSPMQACITVASKVEIVWTWPFLVRGMKSLPPMWAIQLLQVAAIWRAVSERCDLYQDLLFVRRTRMMMVVNGSQIGKIPHWHGRSACWRIVWIRQWSSITRLKVSARPTNRSWKDWR